MSNWTQLTSIPSTNWGMGFGVINGLLYLTRGTSSVRIYTPGTNAWTTATAASPIDWLGPASGVVAGKLYLAGGAFNTGAVRSYDPATDTWSAALAGYPGGIFSAGGLGGSDGLFYVAGGDVGGPDSHVATFKSYNPGSNAWTALTAMPDRRKYPSLIELDGYIYAAGGTNDNEDTPFDSFYRYSITAGTWSTMAAMPEARAGVSIAVLDGKIYVAGGRDAADTSTADDTYRFDPSAGTWETLGADDDIPASRGTSAYGVIDGSFYVAGGISGGGASARLDRYTPVLAGRGWVLGMTYN